MVTDTQDMDNATTYIQQMRNVRASWAMCRSMALQYWDDNTVDQAIEEVRQGEQVITDALAHLDDYSDDDPDDRPKEDKA